MLYRVQNIVRKGEIAYHKQFLLFSEFSYSYISLVCQNVGLCGNGLSEDLLDMMHHRIAENALVPDNGFYLSTTRISMQYHP